MAQKKRGAAKRLPSRKRKPRGEEIHQARLKHTEAEARLLENQAKAVELEIAEKQRRANTAQQSTIAERLEKSAADHNPAPEDTAARRMQEIHANAMFIGAYFLEQLGFSMAEISVVFNCGTGEAEDRVVTGRQIAKLNGISTRDHAERFRAMRENQWATGARVAAQRALDTVDVVLPSAIRACQDSDGVQISRVLEIIAGISVDDIVEVSEAAKRYAKEQGDNGPQCDAKPTGAYLGRAGGALSERGWNDRDNKERNATDAARY